MKMKSLFEEYMEEFKKDTNTLYCCYCLEPQGGKMGCCQENHFVPFEDLYPEDQRDIIENELENRK